MLSQKILTAGSGGYIEPIYLGDGTILVGNEESKLMGTEGVSIIPGPFFTVGEDGENFRSLTGEEAERCPIGNYQILGYEAPSLTMTMTLLWQRLMVRRLPRRGYLHSLESCLKIWKCRISVSTIYGIRRLQICTN